MRRRCRALGLMNGPWPGLTSFLLMFLLVSGAWGDNPAPAKGTPAARPSPATVISPTSLPTDPNVARRLEEASGLLEQGEIDRALYLLQSLLDAEETSFLRVEGNEPVLASQAAANKLLAAGEGVRERYRTLYGPQGAELLARADKEASPGRWAEVARRFRWTAAGRTAADRLATYHLDRAEGDLARIWLEYPAETADDAPATLAMRAAKRAAAEIVAGREPKDSLPGEVPIAGQWVPTRDWLAAFRREWKSLPERSSGQEGLGEQNTWDDLPLLEPILTIPLTQDETLAGVLHEAVAASVSRKSSLVFGYQPVRMEDRWVARHMDGISLFAPGTSETPVALTARSSILTEWKRPDFQTIQLSAAPGGVECAFFANQVYGQVTVDEDRIYFIDDLPLSPHYQQIPAIQRRGGDPSADRSRNTLVCSDARTGKILWRREEFRHSNNADPRSVYFFGPPLAYEGHLYIMGESRAEISLYCLDRKTGEVEWRETLAVATRGVDADLFRRSQRCTITVHSGIMLCPTNLYRVVAFDAAARTRLWDYSLAVEGNLPVHYAMGVQGVIAPVSASADAPLADEGTVVVTEAVGHRIHAVDLTTGEPRWQVPREGDTFLAGIHRGRLVTVSPSRVRAVSLAEGRLLWTLPIDPPAGRGTWLGHRYLLPTVEGRLLVIDTRDGKILHSMTTRDRAPIGNLARWGDRFVSVGGPGIQIFRPIGEVKREVETLLAQRKDDPVGLLRRAQLSLAAGRTLDAVADLQASVTEWRDEESRRSARDLLFEVVASAGGTLDQVQTSLVESLGKLAESDAQKGIYLRLRATERLRAEDIDGVVSAVDEHSFLPREEIVPTDGAVVRTHASWAHAFLKGAIASSASRAARFRALWKKRIDEATARKEIDRLADLALVLPEASLAGEARRSQAKIFSEQSDPAGAERCWLELAEQGDKAVKIEAWQMLARQAIARDRWTETDYFARRLEEINANEAREIKESMSDAARTKKGAATAWSFDSIRTVSERAYRPDPNKRIAFPHEAGLPFFQDWTILFDQQRWELEFLRRDNGHIDWKLTNLPPSLAYQQPVNYHQVGNILLFEQSDSIYCVSGIDRRLVWHRSFDDTSAEVTRAVGTSGNVRIVRASSLLGSSGQVVWPKIVSAGSPRVVVRAGRHLLVLDLATGKTLWSRGDLRQDHLVSADQEYVVLMSSAGQALVHRTADGEVVSSVSAPFDTRSLRGMLGRKMLLFQTAREGDQARVLKLFDPAQGKDVWKQSLPAGTEWKMADDQHIVLFGGGRVIWVESATGKVALEDELDLGPQEASGMQLSGFTDGDRLYLTAMRAVPGQTSWPVSPSNNLKLTMVHGWVRAYDRASRRLLWNQEMFNRSLITAPGQDLPVLVAVGNRMVELGENRKRLATDVELYDKKTGRRVAAEQHDQYGTMLELASTLSPPTVELRGYNLKVRFEFDSSEPTTSATPPSTDSPEANSPFLQRFLERAREERKKKGNSLPSERQPPSRGRP